jgi:hypothetical protein
VVEALVHEDGGEPAGPLVLLLDGRCVPPAPDLEEPEVEHAPRLLPKDDSCHLAGAHVQLELPDLDLQKGAAKVVRVTLRRSDC